MITMIAARSRSGVIGSENSLPWQLVGELKYFKQMTEGLTVVMGRKTFESMGSKPLPNRVNIVLSRDPNFHPEGEVVPVLGSENLNRDINLMVIGGEQIYREFLSEAERLILTEVDIDVEGDARFPDFSMDEWELQSSTPTTYFDKISGQDINCNHNIYVRK